MKKGLWNKINKLKKLAKKALPGPWDYILLEYDKDKVFDIVSVPLAKASGYYRDDWPGGEVTWNVVAADIPIDETLPPAGVIRKNDAKYIAAANPAMILELIEDLEKLDEEKAKAYKIIEKIIKNQKLLLKLRNQIIERLEKEADWLAKNCQGENQCPYLAFYRDLSGNARPKWCDCLDNGEEFDCDEYAPDCWRKAAREAVEAQCEK